MMESIDFREAAQWLANLDGDGASDEDFAEFVILSYKIWKNNDPDAELSVDDMLNADTAEITSKLKDILDEIIFSDDIDPSCWWKKQNEEDTEEESEEDADEDSDEGDTEDKLTREDFFVEWNGTSSSYSKFMLIGVTADQVVSELNALIRKGECSEDDVIGGEEHTVRGTVVVSFYVWGIMPDDILYDLTKALSCKGYADTAWDVTYTICAYNGEDSEDFTAEWDNDCPERMDYAYSEPDDIPDEDINWDAFVKITDPTGAEFYTGGGAVGYDVMEYYRDMVYSH